ncbi:MAG: protein kinase [Oscillospiraceae bacterium]|nr:protein kinase [Oscillospiraceae bacterium]
MDIYTSLMTAIKTEYYVVKELKTGPRGLVQVLRHKASGKRFVFRHYEGTADVYRRLLPISCANLPQIMEVGEKGGKVVVLEEYIQGDTLYYLLEGSLIPPEEAKKILRQLCSALWVLHSLGAVHRDIKPENVILRGSEAVLIDFDASRIYKAEQDNDTKVLGTVGFAAPEQYGISQSDGRADIYSMGVLLNIMLTGKHPSVELAEGKLGRVVQKCTMMNPQMRYDSVLSLMEAL